MLDFIINGIIWTLALYGLIEIIKTIYYICTCTKLESDGIYFIIAVKNQEEKIEGFMRSLLFKILYGKEECIKKVILTDLGSTDKTKEIIEKLEQDYKFINLVDWKICRDLIDNIAHRRYKRYLGLFVIAKINFYVRIKI